MAKKTKTKSTEKKKKKDTVKELLAALNTQRKIHMDEGAKAAAAGKKMETRMHERVCKIMDKLLAFYATERA